MKKLFFFRSSASSNSNSNRVSPPSTDKQVYWEKPPNDIKKCRSKKQDLESPGIDVNPCLRRSLSFSSGSVYNDRLVEKNFDNEGGVSSSSNNVTLRKSGCHSSRCRTLTPERKPKSKYFEVVAVQNDPRAERHGCAASLRSNYESSESSSNCSSNVSTRVLDRFIDGEQEEKHSESKRSSSLKSHKRNVNGGGKRPPRVQYHTPGSPTDETKQKPRFHSFREDKGSHFSFSSRSLIENGFGHESPRRLAKHVIQRLSQAQVSPKLTSKEFEPATPITIEDINDGLISRYSDEISPKNIELIQPNESIDGYLHEDSPKFIEREFLYHNNYGVVNSVTNEENTDADLISKSKDADERVMSLSEELGRESFLCDTSLSVPSLIQTIRNLTEEKVSMALEISAILHDRISDKASAREELNLARSELDSQTRRLEKEKSELQFALEKEMDRRANEWSIKFERYQKEENRLRERVRELAEQNVFLQKDVSSCNERELDGRNRITYLELQLKDLTAMMDEARDNSKNLHENLAKLQEKCGEAEDDRDCLRRAYEEKARESKELHSSVTKLLRTCSEQEKTIDGLRGLNKEVGQHSLDNFDIQLRKLQMEQMRLAGVERALRKEVGSYRLEVDSLRGENINLLYRLKGTGNEGGSSIFKLDQELRNRIHCIQNEGLLLLTESTHLCLKLLEHIKDKAGCSLDTQDHRVVTNGLDAQFVVESDVKVHGLKRGIEKLSKSLETGSAVLHDMLSLVDMDPISKNLHDCSKQSNCQNPNVKLDKIQSELRAETLLTSLLREKLYSKELEVEQLQAELAAAVRGNDILKCEVQNTMDTISCMTHKMKDLELLMIKKDENINQLQNNLHECTKELRIVKGILPKVSEERDLMWEQVKQHTEKNMLLNSENNILKKKIETLDEQILLKEGQISILKDSMGKHVDLLGSPDSTREFLLE